jgi:serine/threonine-protein kinase RsbW
MESDFSRTLSDGRAGLPALMDAVEAHLAAAGAPEAASASVLIALDEVMANVIDYGGEAGASPSVEVAVRVADDRIAVEVTDDGRAFNPIAAATPDTSGSLEDRPIGGLGIHLVKRLMDAVDYERSQGRNHLRFSRAYSSGSAS